MSASGCSSGARAASRRGAVRRALLVAAPALLATSLAALGVPRARASVEAAAERAGLELLERLGPALVGEPRAVTLNGERLYLASRATSLGVAEVLAAVERHCQSAFGGAPATPDGAPAAPVSASAEPPGVLAREPEAREMRAAPGRGLATALDPERWLLARRLDDAGGVGQLACLVRRDGRGLLERLRDFARSGDLASVGDARYVLARRAPGSDLTHVLLAWTAGSFSPLALLAGPRRGPSPLGLLPPGAEPLLSARVEGEPQALELYASADAPGALLAHHERELPRLGFAAVPAGDAPSPGRRAFVSAERVVLVSAERDRAGITRVALVSLARPPIAVAEEAP